MADPLTNQNIAMSAGTVNLMESGTVSLVKSGTLGLVDKIGAGTIDLVKKFNAGTIDLLAEGTVNVVESGTLGLVSKLQGGTIDHIVGGTIDLIAQLDVQVQAGTIDLLEAGTLDLVSQLAAGTINTLEKGTVSVVESGTLGLVSQLAAGTINTLEEGTISVVESGTLGLVNEVAAGTIDLVSAVADLEGGTVDLVAQLAAGTLGLVSQVDSLTSLATVTKVDSVEAGTIDLVSAVAAVESGTLGLVSQLAAGTLGLVAQVDSVEAGTIDLVAAVADLEGGTIDLVSAVAEVEAGTIDLVSEVAAGTVNTLEEGTVSVVESGTIDLVSQLAAGTINTLEEGTVSVVKSGTLGLVSQLASGTIDMIKQTQSPWVNIGSVTFGTVGTAGTEFATLGADINFANQLVLVPRGDQWDNGILWSEFQTVYQYGSEGVWDTVKCKFGCVVERGTGYFMYQNAKGTAYQITVQESADGIVWGTGHQAVAFNQEGSWDTDGIEAQTVVLDGGTTFKMWCIGEDASATMRVLYATSADGLAWTAPVQCMDVGSAGASDRYGLDYIGVIRDGAGFKTVYGGKGPGGGAATWSLVFATSEDGITWTDRQTIFDDEAVLGTDWENSTPSFNFPWLATDGTMYKLWFNAGTNVNDTFYATSADCITWGSVIHSFGSSQILKEPCTVKQGTYWQMWMAAYEAGTTYFATSQGTPDNNLLLWDVWDGTVLSSVGTSINFKPDKDAPFVGPAYYFSDFGPTIQIGVVNNATEIALSNVYVDVYAR